MPKVSVIIPTYNNANYICEAIDSVLKETYTDYEVIVVDDGSTDNTKDILSRYDGKIRYFYQENHGPSAARNKGIREAKGELIAFLDADDILLNDSIRHRAELFNRYPHLGIIFADYYVEDNPSQNNFTSELQKNNFLEKSYSCLTKINNDYYITNNDFFYFSVKNGMYISTDSVMIKRSVINKVGYFANDLLRCQDTDFWYRIIELFPAGYVNIPLSIYKKSRGGYSKTKKLRLLERIECYKKLTKLNFCVKKKNELKKIIGNKISICYYDLGEYYIFNTQRLLAMKSHIIGIFYNFLNFDNWAGLFKACLLTMSIRTFLRERAKKWIKSVL